MILISSVTSFSCYETQLNESGPISWGECDSDVKHCQFRNSSGGKISRSCALDSHMKYFKQHDFGDQGCIMCEEPAGFNMGEGMPKLEMQDLICICNTNFCNGVCTGKGCKENAPNNVTVDHCESDCMATWKDERSHGELMYHNGYIWYLQAIICVIMHEMKKLC